MLAKFDSFNRFETPALLLCSPGAALDEYGAVTNAIGYLNNTSDEEVVANFNELSEFNFAIHKVSDEDDSSQLYSSVKNRQYVFIEDVGFFRISSVEEHIEPLQTFKDVKLQSCEVELEDKVIPADFYAQETGTSGTYTFEFQTLVELLMSNLPLWTIGTIDNSLINTYRTFEDVSEDTNILSFMIQDMQDAYECIFLFDTIHRTVNAYAQNNYVRRSPIIISNDDVVKSIQISSEAEDIYTALSVFGDNDTSISGVNPLGGSTIYKFDYYLNDMPTALRNKVSAWQTAVTNAESNYADLTSDYNTARDTESDLKRTVEMYTYQIDKYTECKNNIVGSSGLPANVEAGFAVSDDDWFRVSSVITKAKNESGIQIEVTKVYSESRSISNNTSSTTYVPKGTSGSQIVALYIKDSDGKYIKKLTQTTASAVPTDCFRVNAANKVITFHTGQFANATQIAVFYHPVNEEVEEASVIITDLVEDLEEKITELEGLRTAANAQLSNATTLVNSLKSQREAIVNNLALDKYFTSSELDILSLYIYEGSYTDEYLTLTDSMSYSERVEELEALYQRGKTQLNKIATPTEKFSVDVENFIFQEKFSHWTESLETGVLIAVEIHPEEVADLFLTNFTVNYEDATMSMTFGNRYNKYDQKSLFENLLGQVKRSANTINFIKEQIYPVTSGELDDMKLALENMRTLSFGDALAAQNQSFIIDSTGITGTQTDDDGTVHDEQIKIINNMIVMTDDSWESCKLALGKIMTPGGVQRYGLNTEVLMGDLILGSQLRIKNNSNGLVFDDNGLEITNNVNTFRVNPNNSNQLLSISKDNSDLFYVDANGVLYLSNGIVIGGANGSTIGGFVIDVTSIHSDALNSTSSGSIGLSTLDFARTINNIPHNDLRFAIGGKFGVASNGTLYASNAVIDGTITSNNATITGGSIQISTSNQDDDIIQLNLQYDTDYGISSVDSSMRSGGFGVKEYTYDGKSLFIDNYLTMDFDYINGESVMKGLSDLGIRMTRVLPNENEEDILDISLANKSINIFNNPLRDFVIQELFNNYGWSVRKWYSGLLECWYKERFTSFSITTARGSVYRDLVTISDPNYPVSFIETPTVLACVNVNSGDGWGGYARDGDKDKMHTMYAYSAVSGSHNLTVQIYVVGRWKQ